MIENQPWRSEAACLGHDTDLWFPERGDNPDAAKAICATCPVREPCLEVGIAEPFGVFGGLTFNERRNLRRRATYAAKSA